jgi:hypothetical protein
MGVHIVRRRASGCAGVAEGCRVKGMSKKKKDPWSSSVVSHFFFPDLFSLACL